MKVNVVNRANKDQGQCLRCGVEIKRGDAYKWAQGRYTSRRVVCSKHSFKRSELTGSANLSELYSAQESAHDEVDVWEMDPEARDEGGLEDALNTAKEAAQAVEDTYREAAEAMGGAGADNEERADLVQAWYDELENVALEPFPGADEEEEGQTSELTKEEAEALDLWKGEQAQLVREAIDALEM